MTDKMPPLPALPNPEAYRVRWLTGPDEGWSQWHDEVDPLPSSWDEAPPDEVTPYYSAAQVQDIARAYAAQRVAPLVEALSAAVACNAGGLLMNKGEIDLCIAALAAEKEHSNG